ncbi:hypothetical protein Bbelb_155290 [Branchiostoma belcheri]|nr:hypothetical protein Bbelb_155290 [Branchiostoma belcheri]
MRQGPYMCPTGMGHKKTSSEHLPGTCRRPTNEGAPAPLQGSVKANFNCDHNGRCPVHTEPGDMPLLHPDGHRHNLDLNFTRGSACGFRGASINGHLNVHAREARPPCSCSQPGQNRPNLSRVNYIRKLLGADQA